MAGTGALAQTPAEVLRTTPEQRAASVKMVELLRAAQSPLLQGAPGLLVALVDPAAQAARLGIAPGDVLLTYDGRAVSSPEQFVAAVAAKSAAGAGAPVQVVLLRSGANVTVTAQSGRFGVGVTPIVSLGAGAPREATANAGDARRTLIFPQLGHASGPTMAVAYSPDGALIASAGADNTIKLWDAASGREMRSLVGHTNIVFSVAFSPDGRLILSGGNDKMIRLWDVATGRQLYSALGDRIVVNSVAFSPDGRQAVSVGSENKVILWDVATGLAERIIPDPSGHVTFMTSIAFSVDGRHVLTGGHDLQADKHQLSLWDVVEGKLLRTFSGHSEMIKSVAFSPDGRQAVSASQDKTLRIWDIATGRSTQTLRTSSAQSGGAWSPDGRYVAGVGIGVTLWDPGTGQAVRELKSSAPSWQGGPVVGWSLAFGPGGQLVVGSAGELLTWDAASGTQTHTLVSAAYPMSSLALTPDGKQFAVTGWREVVSLWNAADGKLAQSITSGLPPGKDNRGVTESSVRAAAISPDGRYVLAANNDLKLRLSELVTGKELRVFEGHNGSVAAVAFSPDGQLAASGGGFRDTMFKGVVSMQYDGTVRVWRVATGETVRVLSGHTSAVSSVAFSPDGRQILSAAPDSVRLWDVASGATLRVMAEFANSAAFSPDGRTALVCGLTLTLIDLATGAVLRPFEGHANQVFSAVFSADGAQALSGSADNTVKLWDVASGKMLRTFNGHVGAVKSVAFSKDGKQVVSAADDATLRVWDLASGRQLVQMVSFKNGEWMAITPEGYFNASSPKATEFLNITQDQKVYGAGQFYDVFYRPDIVQAALAGRDTRAMVALTIDDAIRNPPPTVSDMQAPAAGTAERVRIAWRVQTAGGGIGEVRVFHNGKLVSSDGVARRAPDALLGKKVDQQTPEALVSQMRGLAGGGTGAAVAAATTSAPKGDAVDSSIEIEPVPGDNDVSVIAFNAQNSIQSVVRTVSFKSTRPAVAPRLHILAIGIDEYKDKGVSLKFAAKDARDLGARWQQQAAGIYGADNITLETLTNAQASRAGILAKIDEIAARVRPTDHFMLFIASHGVLLGEQYYMVTNDYDGALTPNKLISSAEIVDFSKRIKALSQLYILDTCHAGGMGGVVAGLYDARVSVLARKMGLHVFASASSTEEALDGFEGNGLFTHTLLSGLNNNRQADSNADQQISLTELGSFSKVQTRDIAVTQKHKQDPLIINFGQDTPVYKLR